MITYLYAISWHSGKGLTSVLIDHCIQFYSLLSPYLCLISFLYLDLYVLGDDALIS